MVEKEKTNKKAKRVMLIMNIAALVLFLAVCVFIAVKLMPLISIYSEEPSLFTDYISENLFAGIFIFLGIQILQIVVAVIPGEFVEIAAGVVFGAFFGFLLSMLGVALATSVIFFVTRKLGRPLVYAALGEEKMKRFEKYGEHKRRDSIIFWLFFIPGIPKDILTYAAPFFGISLPRFLIITLTARIPSVLSSTIAASYAMDGNILAAVLIFAVCGIIAAAGYFLSEKIMNRLERK
ncbi:MAG: TVP38/TMEM64 family protein [Ruminococcaceae bacterium]|nr:TVP38/TMEM64 family protein [Oscillospiraceae bacterium]